MLLNLLFGHRSMRIFSFILALAAAFLFSSCEPMKKQPLEYQNGEIFAEISGDMNQISFTAELYLSAISDEKTGEEKGGAQQSDSIANGRRFSLSMKSPKTLEGLVFEGTLGGEVRATLGTLELDFEKLENLPGVTAIVSAFLVSGQPSSTSAVKGVDVGLPNHEKLTKLTFDGLVIYLSPESSHPVKIQTLAENTDKDLCSFVILVNDFRSN